MEKLFKFFLLFFLIGIQIKAKASDFMFRMHNNSSFTIVFNQSLPVYNCPFFQQFNLSPGNYSIEIYNSCLSVATPCAIPLYRGVVSVPANVQLMTYLDSYHRFQTGGVIPIQGLLNGGPGSGSNNVYRSYFTNPWSNLNDSLGYLKAQKSLEEISNNKFKVAYLKRCIYFYGISSIRLSEIMKTFTFDSERLDLATFAYPFTVDKENYGLVYDAFIFQGSKNQLDNYLYYQASQIRW